MKTVGLTGNVASGKTTVADRWRAAGVPVLDADRIGHDVLRENAAAKEALVEAFGEEILAADGAIDRTRLGERAFRSKSETERLNAIVHPPLVDRLSAAIGEAERAGEPIVVVDAALIFEFGFDARLETVVLVTAPRDVRAERLRDRGFDERQIALRMASQMPDAEKLDRSDYVIVNDGPIELLEAKADAVLADLRLADEGADRAGGAG